MCKEMMEQRVKIKMMLNDALEECLRNIQKNGKYLAPTVMVSLENLFIANREYFEHQGFFFDPQSRIENNHVKYYAWVKLGGEGEMGRAFWKRIRETQEDYMKAERNQILEALRSSGGGRVCVPLDKILFENKMFFEECGYVFIPATGMRNGQCMAWMEKRKR